jgi:hypothetical protein
LGGSLGGGGNEKKGEKWGEAANRDWGKEEIRKAFIEFEQ